MSNNNQNQLNPHQELPPLQRPPSSHIQQQQQQQTASVYPKIPSQDELPSYTPYVVFPTPQQASSSQQQQPPLPYPQQYQQYIQQPQPYNTAPCNHYPQRPTTTTTYYGSMAAPNISSPAPIPPQNNDSNRIVVHALNDIKTKTVLVECPHCHQLVYTVLDYDIGLCTGISIAGLFLAGCNNGLCLLPALFPCTKDITHQCPSCKKKIATFTRLERDTRILAPPPAL